MNEIGAFDLDDIGDDGHLILPKDDDGEEEEAKPVKKKSCGPVRSRRPINLFDVCLPICACCRSSMLLVGSHYTPAKAIHDAKRLMTKEQRRAFGFMLLATD